MSTLQELLNLGLVPIGPDDSVFGKIKAASSAFAEKLKENPSLLIPATFIALARDLHEDAPPFPLVEELLIEEWNTLRNTHVNRPRELLRSIIIDALSEAIGSTTEAAAAVWNAAASRLRHGQVCIGKAKEIVERILIEASDRAETEAVSRAGLVVPTYKRSRKKKPVSGKSWTIDGTIKEDEIVRKVVRAAGPYDRDGQSLNDPNQYWPNSPEEWSYEFAPRMATAIVDAVNLGIKRLIASLGEKIPGEIVEYEKQLRDQLRGVTQYHSTSQMRIDVLWWSESLYSPSCQVGYRELPLSVAAVAAAMDLAAIVPPLVPASVCYVLFETVHRIARTLNATEDQPIVSYLDSLCCAGIDFGDGVSGSITDDSNVPLLCLVAEASSGGRFSSEGLRLRSGIDGDMSLSAAEFAMWVFRDLQARRLVDELR